MFFKKKTRKEPRIILQTFTYPSGDIKKLEKEKTIEYYKNDALRDHCTCSKCEIYYKEIKQRYPELAEYLAELGADIERPFEAPSFGMSDTHNYEQYYAWYIIIGECDDNYARKLGNLTIHKASHYPGTNVTEQHFVLEVNNIIIK